MAKYMVIHSCSHSEQVELYGKEAERERKITWLQREPCSACNRSEQVARASAQAAELGLAALIGSEKQIAWAATIRQEFVNEFERRFAQAQGSPEEAVRARTTFMAIINRRSDARFWIDHRSEGIRIFAEEWEAAYAK